MSLDYRMDDSSHHVNKQADAEVGEARPFEAAALDLKS